VLYTTENSGTDRKGYSFARTLNPPTRNVNLSLSERKEYILGRLKRREYDLIIYGNFLSSRELFVDYSFPLYSVTPERLWLFDGRDKFGGWPFQLNYGTLRFNSTIFVRELF
jgi:hypothetical protein